MRMRDIRASIAHRFKSASKLDLRAGAGAAPSSHVVRCAWPLVDGVGTLCVRSIADRSASHGHTHQRA